MRRTGFLGAGKMAEAMIYSMLSSKKWTSNDLFAVDVKPDRAEHVSHRFGILTGVSAPELILKHNCDTLVLAVKPQDLNTAIDELAPLITQRHLALSIAAGKTIASLERRLPNARIVRIMPNLPCTVGQGISAFCAGTMATNADRKDTASLLACLGKAIELPENMFDTVTALSGSGPAFFAFVLDAMVSAAVNLGLNHQQALLLSIQTMLGTAQLLQTSEMRPDELINAVASARGTTSAGLQILNASDLPKVLANTLRAAAERSRELSLEAP